VRKFFRSSKRVGLKGKRRSAAIVEGRGEGKNSLGGVILRSGGLLKGRGEAGNGKGE